MSVFIVLNGVGRLIVAYEGRLTRRLDKKKPTQEASARTTKIIRKFKLTIGHKLKTMMNYFNHID
ncbi:hypothetical protein ACLFLC_15110 [Providencia rettgeri]